MLTRTFLQASRPASRAFTAARAFSTTTPRALAKIQLIGHLAGTPELTPTSTGNDIIKYSLATSSGPRDNRQTSWWRVSAFIEPGPRRDFLLALDKGTLVYVEGEVKMDQFTDAEGKERKALNIVHRECAWEIVVGVG
jgi:single stranded DNA-binding protein